ncbi:class I adenylate-forming enzyme family protein [Thalassobacillus sp. CUG 92003]|uniref:class I adenylate-forming enzyme family protein n=1 Tax=Thalassobacillus sp. CUG 92003 TaxID=2736641 RepID=UPI00351A482F
MLNHVRIVDENGEDVEAHQVGELLLKGYHTFEYYWNKQHATDQVWDEGWLYTGDLARHDQDGYVYIVGRKKEMIITGGENVYPLEIEHWVDAHPDVDEAAVVGVPHEKWGEIVIAFLSMKDNSTPPTVEQLAAYCRKKLAVYKVPKQFHIVDELPKTHVGKIDKNALIQKVKRPIS